MEKKPAIWGIVVLGIAATSVIGFVLVRLLPMYLVARETGETYGSGLGHLVGTATGSKDGFTTGLNEGYEDGKEDGLSAEDTIVERTEEITAVGTLEVLSADIELVDDLTVGNSYEAIIVYHGTATFSVDMTQAEITVKGNEVTVTLPTPECEFTLDESATEELAHWQNFPFSGSTQAGYEAYNNSAAEVAEQASENMLNYDAMLKQAQESAKSQVETLTKAMKGDGYEVTVLFNGEEGLIHYAE